MITPSNKKLAMQKNMIQARDSIGVTLFIRAINPYPEP